MKIIDDIFPEQFQNYVENLFLSDNFPWYFSSMTADSEKCAWDKNTKDSIQFCHVLVRDAQSNSPLWANLHTMAQWIILKENLKIESIARVKVNLTLPDKNHTTGIHLPAHTDTLPGATGLTGIYYVNDSDGDTLFFKNQENPNDELEEIARVSPKKGRLVLFDCNTLHAGCLPDKAIKRCVLNLNFPVEQP